MRRLTSTSIGSGQGYCSGGPSYDGGVTNSADECWSSCASALGFDPLSIDWWGQVAAPHTNKCYCTNDCTCMEAVGYGGFEALVAVNFALPIDECPAPTPQPTLFPTAFPTPPPTPLPSSEPSPLPSGAPSSLPSPAPTPLPTIVPTLPPTIAPSSLPTTLPTPHTSTTAPTPVRFAPAHLFFCFCIIIITIIGFAPHNINQKSNI